MDAKLIDLSDLLNDIEDMRQKAQQQLVDLDDYFNNVTSVISRRASLN